MTVYRDSAGNLIEGPDTTTVYVSSTGAPMDGLPSTPDPYLNAAGQLMGGDPNFPREGGGLPPDLAVFKDGTEGFLFDFSKTDRLFQEAKGSTPADDPGENIGLAFESHAWASRTFSEEMAQQPELLGNPDFSTDSIWSKNSSWTISAGVAAHSAANGDLSQAVAVTPGSTYRLSSVVVTTNNSNICRMDLRGGTTVQGPSIVTGAGVKVGFLQAAVGNNALHFAANSGWVGSIDDASLKLIPGNHAQQATMSAQPKYQDGGLARFDGADDNLLTTLTPSAVAGTLMAKIKATATASNKIIIGAGDTSTGWCTIEVRSNGLVGGRLGTQTSAVITGGADVHDLVGVVAMTYDASTVTLYWNGVQVYQAARSGTPATASPFMLGAANNAGAGAGFYAGDEYYALAIQKALTPAEILAITNQWSAS